MPQALGEWLLGLSKNPIVVLLVINAALLVVGTVLDITPAILIFTPILLPAVTQLGIDPVHFGIIMVMNLCIGPCTPPVGSVLFVGCEVSGARLGEVVRPLLPLYAVMVAVLLGVTLWPPCFSRCRENSATSRWNPGISGADRPQRRTSTQAVRRLLAVIHTPSTSRIASRRS